jgi:ADP-heptose:LPS heptosyltransferase
MTDVKDPWTLVIFPGALGDFICFIPTLLALAETAFVDLFARSEFADLLPERVRVRSLESYPINRLFVPDAGREDKLHGFFAGYASIYSWMGSGNEVFVQQLQKLCDGRAHIFPFDSEAAKGHQSEHYLSCIAMDGRQCLLPEINMKPEAITWSAGYWTRHGFAGRPVLIIAPGSGAREKNWPVGAFATVAEWWRSEGGEALILLGPVEEERGGFEALLRQCPAARNLPLAKLAALIARADIYLGNDSGITHLAAALGIPTLAVFGPSNVNKWRPRGQRVVVLRHSLECAPCANAIMKNCQHRSCLCGLEPMEVIQELRMMAGSEYLDKVGGRD